MEWPVVERVPARCRVLYTGHGYMCTGESDAAEEEADKPCCCCATTFGFNHNTGSSSYSLLGELSARACVAWSQRAPSKNSPLMYTPSSGGSVISGAVNPFRGNRLKQFV